MKRGEYVPAGEYVTAYTRLGDKEQALAWLDKALQERNGFVFSVRVDPIFDKLRAAPAFRNLMGVSFLNSIDGVSSLVETMERCTQK